MAQRSSNTCSGVAARRTTGGTASSTRGKPLRRAYQTFFHALLLCQAELIVFLWSSSNLCQAAVPLNLALLRRKLDFESLEFCPSGIVLRGNFPSLDVVELC